MARPKKTTVEAEPAKPIEIQDTNVVSEDLASKPEKTKTTRTSRTKKTPESEKVIEEKPVDPTKAKIETPAKPEESEDKPQTSKKRKNPAKAVEPESKAEEAPVVEATPSEESKSEESKEKKPSKRSKKKEKPEEKTEEEQPADKKKRKGFWGFITGIFGKKEDDGQEAIEEPKEKKLDKKSAGQEKSKEMSEEDKEKIKAPSGMSMIDMFSEEKSLDESVENILKSHNRRMSPKKKKKLPETILLEKIASTERFTPDNEQGLTSDQVAKREADGLTNKSKSSYTKSYWEIIKDNVFTFFNIVLIILAICLIVVGAWSNCTFLVIMLANIVIGIFQEVRSKKTIEKLKLVTAPTSMVIRDGKEMPVSTDAIVLDDIIELGIGNQISADSIITQGSIEVNESLLTGESLPIKKGLGDTIYAGSFVTAGSGKARVNKIAEANWAISLQSQAKKFQKPKSELLRSLNRIIKVISFMIIPFAICLVVIGVMNSGETTAWGRFTSGVLNAAGPIVGSVPAGMFLLTSVALAVGVINMSKKKTLVQDLYCFEMLARTNVLCLDKTGTLTDGTMEVNEVIVIDKTVDLDTVMGSYLATFREANQTSLALADRYKLNRKLQVVGKIPFSSSRKYSAVSFKNMGTFVMGAPEFVYKADNKGLVNVISDRQKMGYRVLMLAHSDDYVNEEGEMTGEVVPVALFVLLDHVREEAPATIKWFSDNGVGIKIISGDNPLTASEIAGACGVPNYKKAVSLEGLSLKETAQIADKYTVFGRVSPEQKAILVKSLKQQGKTVGMTGDGVNDILAMKQSDCSIAMASGADAAKNVAHLVLLDSNFASMPAVVLEGRRVINNIQRSSALYLMKTIFTFVLAFVFIILGFATMGGPSASRIVYPFLPSDILLMEFIGIGIPSVMLALQPDKNQIKGHFIKNTFSKAIPGGLTLLIVVAITFILAQVGFFNDSTIAGMENLQMPWFESTRTSIGGNAIRALAGLGLTFASLSILYALSQPFDTYRFTLYIGEWILTLIVVFGIVPYAPFNKVVSSQYTYLMGNKTMILIAIMFAIGCPLITSMLMNAFDFMTKKDVSPTEQKALPKK